MHYYYKIKNPSLSNPAILQSRFDSGIFIERKVAKILLNDSRIVSEQGMVYCDYVGMPEISGRIDFRMGDTLVELKTSEQDVSDEDALFFHKTSRLGTTFAIYFVFCERKK